MAADRRGRGPGALGRAGSPCRPWARLCDRGEDRRPAADRRTEYRLLHDRGGVVHGPRGNGSRDAGGDGPRAQDGRGSTARQRETCGQDMIIGIGSDLIDIRRVAKVIERHGERFLDRIFTDAERARAGRRAKNEKMVVATYAKRFAAKEACSKALGTGIRRGVWWRDVGVVNLPGGRPTMQLTGGALARLEAMTPPGHEARIDLSITDDWPLAQAFVIISAVPAGNSDPAGGH